MFLESLSYDKWKNTTMEDFAYKSKLEQQSSNASKITIPFFQMPFEMINYLVQWFKIPKSIYQWKPYPYASSIQWLSGMDSCFVYVNTFYISHYCYLYILLYIIYSFMFYIL